MGNSYTQAWPFMFYPCETVCAGTPCWPTRRAYRRFYFTTRTHTVVWHWSFSSRRPHQSQQHRAGIAALQSLNLFSLLGSFCLFAVGCLWFSLLITTRSCRVNSARSLSGQIYADAAPCVFGHRSTLGTDLCLCLYSWTVDFHLYWSKKNNSKETMTINEMTSLLWLCLPLHVLLLLLWPL